MYTTLLRTGAIAAAMAVIFGAFGAHKLKEVLDVAELANWETACRYQFYHALALLLTALLSLNHNQKHCKTAALLFGLGILFFSGSLYLLSLRNVLNISASWLGPITPIGGLFFISGWLRLAFAGKAD
ncbi:MAG: DUF423 domain-containing protein [Bacteroidia bacterium]|nr:DUF423 domain-containing protein [Bacteroidia bacterium]